MSVWSDTDLALLGKIVVTFSDLDFYADFLLVGFLPRTTGHLMTAGENVTWKLDKLSVIAIEVLGDTEVKKALCDWVEATRILTSRRNQIMHSVYHEQDGKPSLARMKATTRGGRWKAHSEPVDTGNLQEFAELLAGGVTAAQDLVQRLVGCPDWQGHNAHNG